MTNPHKDALRGFYASEARDRDSAAWLEQGGSARIPESRSSHYFIDRKVAAALELAAIPATARILEVGCSFGHQTFLLAQRFAHVTAVDLSPESIDLARRRAQRWNVHNVQLDVADAEHLEAFPDASFDAVFSFSTVRFCQSQTGALREFARVVRPGAPVVVDFPNANCPWYGPLKRSLKIDPHIHDRLFLPREAEGLLRDSGLRLVTSHPMLFTTKRAPDPLLPLFQAVDAIGERMPGIRGLAGIIMARGVKSDAR